MADTATLNHVLVSHVKRRSIPTFIFPGGVRPLRPTKVAGEQRQVSEAKVPSHAETGKLSEGKATPEGPDDGRKRKHEHDIVGSNLGGSKYLARVGFSSEEGHYGDPFVCISTLDCLKGSNIDVNQSGKAWIEKVGNKINGVIERFKDPAGLPSQNNCGRDESARCSTPIVYSPANAASSSSKEAEKLAIEKIMSGPYVAHQAFLQELEELEDDTEYNGQLKILGGSATKSSMESSTTKSVVLDLTTSNGSGPLSSLHSKGIIEELEPAELVAPLPNATQSTSMAQHKPVIRLNLTSLAKATGKNTSGCEP